MMRFFTESCFRAAFIAATVINSEIMFVYLTLIVLTKGTKGIALWSTNISSKFTLQTHAKYKNTKIQTSLHEKFLLSHQSKKHIAPESKFRH